MQSLRKIVRDEKRSVDTQNLKNEKCSLTIQSKAGDRVIETRLKISLRRRTRHKTKRQV